MKTIDLFTEVMRQLAAAKERQDQLTERYSQAYGFYRGELPAVLQTGDIAARRVMWEAFESLYWHPHTSHLWDDSLSFTTDDGGTHSHDVTVDTAACRVSV